MEAKTLERSEAKLLDVEPSEELRKLGRNGVDLIATERLRQIEQEGYTRDHDAELRAGDLALAAVCYASPVQLFSMEESANGVEFCDPWHWHTKDNRWRYGEARTLLLQSLPPDRPPIPLKSGKVYSSKPVPSSPPR